MSGKNIYFYLINYKVIEILKFNQNIQQADPKRGKTDLGIAKTILKKIKKGLVNPHPTTSRLYL